MQPISFLVKESFKTEAVHIKLMVRSDSKEWVISSTMAAGLYRGYTYKGARQAYNRMVNSFMKPGVQYEIYKNEELKVASR